MTSHEVDDEMRPAEHDAPMGDLPPLRGSVLLAETMERRKFVRRASTSLFLGLMAVSSGTAGLFGFLASPASAAGRCCPYCCGPSPCCNTSCCNKNCCPNGGSSSCANNGSTCLGYAGTWSGSSCWACVSGAVITTCCDCKTNSQSGCPNSNGNRCICWYAGDGPVRAGTPIIRDASQVPKWG